MNISHIEMKTVESIDYVPLDQPTAPSLPNVLLRPPSQTKKKSSKSCENLQSFLKVGMGVGMGMVIEYYTPHAIFNSISTLIWVSKTVRNCCYREDARGKAIAPSHLEQTCRKIDDICFGFFSVNYAISWSKGVHFDNALDGWQVLNAFAGAAIITFSYCVKKVDGLGRNPI